MVDELGTSISTDMVEVNVCGRWPLLVPRKRSERGELWDWWEWPRMASMRANLRPGMVLWDVGTEQGDQSALWARWVAPAPFTEAGGIVLIEANPMVWGNVRAIWEANGIPDPLDTIVAFVGAETADPTDATYADAVAFDSAMMADGWPRCARGPMVGDHGTRHLAYEQDRTPTVTLDDARDRNGLRVDAITMDIEGAEVAALRGASKILHYDRPLVWVSIHPEQLDSLYGLRRDDVLRVFGDHDYLIEHLAAEHELHTFAYPRERADEVVLPYERTAW